MILSRFAYRKLNCVNSGNFANSIFCNELRILRLNFCSSPWIGPTTTTKLKLSMLLPVCITLHALTDASSAQSQTATTSVRNECLHGRERDSK